MTKDLRDVEILIGSLVAWGAGGRRSHGIRIGTVTSIGDPQERADCVRVKCEGYGSGGLKQPRQLVVIVQRPDAG